MSPAPGASNGGVWKTSNGGNWWPAQNCMAVDCFKFVNSGGMTEMLVNRALMEGSSSRSLNFNMWAELVTTADNCDTVALSPTGMPTAPCQTVGGSEFAIYLEVSPTDQMPTDQMPTDKDLMDMGNLLMTIVSVPINVQSKAIIINWKVANDVRNMKRQSSMRYTYLAQFHVSETLQQDVINRIGHGSTLALNASLILMGFIFTFMAVQY
jgi:hypothetical protein